MLTQQQKTQSTAVIAQALELGMQTIAKIQGASLAEAGIDVQQVLANELNNELNNRGTGQC